MKQKILAGVLLGMVSAAAQAQLKTAKFDDGWCEYEGRYDSKKVSAKQIADTVFLLNNGTVLPDFQYRKGSAALTAVYQREQAKLNGLQLIKSPVIALGQKQIAAANTFFYELEMIKARAMEAGNPALLNHFKPAAKQCAKLAGKVSRRDLLLPSQTTGNGLTALGEWHNCANAFQPDVALNGDGKNGNTAAWNALKKQFVRVKTLACNE
ncbi:MAG: hypothetical protein Q4D82_04125 [Neisseria sp.]|nr:hypothetical protein [Neisseria sp.]